MIIFIIAIAFAGASLLAPVVNWRVSARRARTQR